MLPDGFVPDDFHSLHDFSYDSAGYLCGETGCGLCALYQLKQAGITHLKLVGRGNYTDYMEKDIRNLRMALNILRESADEMEFRRKCEIADFSQRVQQELLLPVIRQHGLRSVSEKSFPQIVVHILQKAFFRHALDSVLP